MIFKAEGQQLLAVMLLLLATRTMHQVESVPQGGQAYLPPVGQPPPPGANNPPPNTGAASAPRPQSHGGHPDEWAGDPVNYEFSYEVQDPQYGVDFGHHEMRKDDDATGSYHVLLPDGRHQYVDYVADAGGYRPMIRYEGTASFPPPGPAPGAPIGDGYKYRK